MLLATESVASALAAAGLDVSNCSSDRALTGSVILLFVALILAAAVMVCRAPRLSVRVLMTLAATGLAMCVGFLLILTQFFKFFCGITDFCVLC